MSGRGNDTVKLFSDAQERVVGKFCSNCRLHRAVDGGRTIAAGKRWVCQWCAAKYDAAQEARGVSKP